MQVVESKTNELQHEFKIVISAAEVHAKRLEKLQEIGKHARFDGFRPGKAPVDLLEKNYGHRADAEAQEDLINASLRSIMSEKELKSITRPTYNITSTGSNGDLEFTLIVETTPVVEPADLTSLKLERYTVKVTDQDVEEFLNKIAERSPVTEPLTTDRPAKNGDVLVVDFVGKINGKEFKGGKASHTEIALGKKQFIDGFEDQLIGVKKGEERVLKVTFPKEYHAKELAGQPATFDVTVHEIREPVKFVKSDEWASKYGYESLEDMLTHTRKSLSQARNQLGETFTKRLVLDKLAEMHNFAIPNSLVTQEFKAIWSQVQHELEGHEHSDTCQHDHLSEEECKSIAERRVRLGLLLAEIGRRSNLKVNRADLQRALQQEVMRYDNPKKAYEYITKNEQLLAQIQAPLFEDLAIAHILSTAEVKEIELTEADLQKRMEEYDAKAESSSKKNDEQKTVKAKKAAKTEES